MSGLTRKQVYVDRNLSAVIGFSEGVLVSYADIQKGLHKYIKDNDLRNPQGKPQPAIQASLKEGKVSTQAMKRCRDCTAEIPVEAIFCDMCGVSQ